MQDLPNGCSRLLFKQTTAGCTFSAEQMSGRTDVWFPWMVCSSCLERENESQVCHRHTHTHKQKLQYELIRQLQQSAQPLVADDWKPDQLSKTDAEEGGEAGVCCNCVVKVWSSQLD